jgi:acetate kinase
MSVKPVNPWVLTISGGSSNIKFGVNENLLSLKRTLHGKVDRIGTNGTAVAFEGRTPKQHCAIGREASDYKSAVPVLLNRLGAHQGFDSLQAIGHRVAHGIQHTKPELVTKTLLDEPHADSPLDPDHLPCEIDLIESPGTRFPQLHQAAVSTPLFHCTMPRFANLVPIPRRYDAKGMRLRIPRPLVRLTHGGVRAAPFQRRPKPCIWLSPS